MSRRWRPAPVTRSRTSQNLFLRPNTQRWWITGCVAVVMSGEDIEGFAGVPEVYSGFGHAGPGEGSVGLGLVAAVDLKRIVGRGAAKAIALGADVAEGAGIDQYGAASR